MWKNFFLHASKQLYFQQWRNYFNWLLDFHLKLAAVRKFCSAPSPTSLFPSESSISVLDDLRGFLTTWNGEGGGNAVLVFLFGRGNASDVLELRFDVWIAFQPSPGLAVCSGKFDFQFLGLNVADECSRGENDFKWFIMGRERYGIHFPNRNQGGEGSDSRFFPSG